MNELLGHRIKVSSDEHNGNTGIVLIDKDPMYYVGWDNPRKFLGSWINKNKVNIESTGYCCHYDERIIHSNLLIRSRTLHCYDDLTVPRVRDCVEYIGDGTTFSAVVLKVKPQYTRPPIFVVVAETLIPLYGSYVIAEIGPFCFKKVESLSKEEMLTHSVSEIRKLALSKKKLRTML